MEEKKCIWTGKRDPSVKAVRLKTLDRYTLPAEKTFHVLPQHEEDLRRYNDRFVKYGQTFLYLLMGLIVTLLLMNFATGFSAEARTWLLLLSGVITMAMGAAIIGFPFTTPETSIVLGLNKARRVGYMAGAMTIFLGGMVCYWAIW